MLSDVPETVVLLHGFAGTGRLWDPVVARLDAERYRPLAPDLVRYDPGRLMPTVVRSGSQLDLSVPGF